MNPLLWINSKRVDYYPPLDSEETNVNEKFIDDDDFSVDSSDGVDNINDAGYVSKAIDNALKHKFTPKYQQIERDK